MAAPAQPAAVAQPPAPVALSSSAEKVYAQAKPRLIQVRTLLASANRQSTIGSGFVVGPDGVAITNYHVVSQFALEPQTYRLEYRAPDGASGPLALLAFDVVHDLAVVRLDKPLPVHFEFDPRAVDGTMPKGERLYAMGNPLDLGFTIVEGTYNGLVDRSYNEQVHFSGALNAGMSGGPTVTGDGRVAGVNVAVSRRGQLVSFLVPARHADALVRRAREPLVLDAKGTRAELGRQLAAWQSGLHRDLAATGFKPATFGAYLAPESQAPWFQCWASTNADAVPRPRFRASSTQCSAQSEIFVTPSLYSGRVEVTHEHLVALDLHPAQFATAVTERAQARSGEAGSRKHLTRPRCVTEPLRPPAGSSRPPVLARFCARAYRDFDGLFNATLTTVTQDRQAEALVSRLSMQGVTWENALALSRRFLREIRWAK